MKKKSPAIWLLGNLRDDPVPTIALNRLSKALKEISQNVDVVTGSIVDGNEISKPQSEFHKQVSNCISSARNQIAAIREFRRKKYDCGVVTLPFLILPCIMMKLASSKLIIYVGGRASFSIRGEIIAGEKGRTPIYVLMSIIETVSFSIADLIVIESAGSVERLGLERYSSKIFICGQWLDSDIFRISKLLMNRTFDIGFVGRLNREKGILEFIEAARIILQDKPSTRIIIAGTGDLEGSIRKRIFEDPLLSKGITIAGWVDHSDMPGFLNDLKLMVLPSYSEGTPNAVLEAMACGTVVLATPVGGIPELVIDDYTGFILTDLKPIHMADSMIRIISTPNLQSIAESARTAVEDRYSFDRVVKCYKDVFDKLNM